MRQRTDKEEGNAMRTVQNVLKSIEEPILIEDLIPVVEGLKDEFVLNGLGKRENPFSNG